jgi:hypothetical protein
VARQVFFCFELSPVSWFILFSLGYHNLIMFKNIPLHPGDHLYLIWLSFMCCNRYVYFQDAFVLWDTYGYPIDLTEVCSSHFHQ